MNENQKECYELLVNEICFINLKWQVYKQLFGTCEENINLLDELSGVCFGIFQRTLYDNIILSISRLTDPSKQFGKENLSLERMIDLLYLSSNKEICSQLEISFKEIKSISKDLHENRNKRIGHNDFLSFKFDFSNLNGISRKRISEVLSLISDFMNIISRNLEKTDRIFEVFGYGGDAGNILINNLKELLLNENKDS